MPMTPYMRNQGDPPIVPATAAAARRTPVTIETATRRRGLTSPPGLTQRIPMNPAAMTTTTNPMVAAMTVPDMPALLPRRAVDEGGPGATHTGQASGNTERTDRSYRWDELRNRCEEACCAAAEAEPSSRPLPGVARLVVGG